MLEKTSGAWYIISVAAERAEVHEQTLRHYERLGLIAPARKGSSPHSPRLYSDRDIERVQQIRSLMRDLMEHLQDELEKEMDALRTQHANETRRLKDIIERLQQRDPNDVPIVHFNDVE
jgi:MerR family transcriptional regulator/heat shock protein HspR